MAACKWLAHIYSRYEGTYADNCDNRDLAHRDKCAVEYYIGKDENISRFFHVKYHILTYLPPLLEVGWWSGGLNPNTDIHVG